MTQKLIGLVDLADLVENLFDELENMFEMFFLSCDNEYF